METYTIENTTATADTLDAAKRAAVVGYLQRVSGVLPTEQEIAALLAEIEAAEAIEQAAEQAAIDFRTLPGWASWTGAEAADYINGQVLSGMTPDQVEAWVRVNITSFDKAITGFILVGRELAELRAVREQMARAIMYLRDVAIR